MTLEITYSKQSLKFLKKNNEIIDVSKLRELLFKAARRIISKEDVNVDLIPMKGEFLGLFRIRYRNIRIIFQIDSDNQITVVFVETIDFRGSVYK